MLECWVKQLNVSWLLATEDIKMKIEGLKNFSTVQIVVDARDEL
jgi:hypothetical protein